MVHLDCPSPRVVVEHLSYLHVGFGTQKGMPVLFAPANKYDPHLPRPGQFYIKHGSFNPPRTDPPKFVSGHLVPELRQGHRLTPISVVGLVAFQPANNAVSNGKDLGNDLVRGKPGVKQNKTGTDAVLPAPLDHLDQKLCLLLKGFHPPLPAIGSFVHFSRLVIGSIL